MMISGEFHNGLDTRKHPATLILGRAGHCKVIWGEGELSGSLGAARISARLGNIPRHIHFTNDAEFTTTDNDAVDEAVTAAGAARNPSFIHKLEDSPRIALTALVLLAVSVLLFFQYGVPALSQRVVALIPPDVERDVGLHSMDMLDRFVFAKSKLDDTTQDDIRRDFYDLLRAQGYTQHVELQFRDGQRIGSNAFALPGGYIIVTDQLVKLADDRREIMAVLGHELGHIVHKHGMRRIVENSAIAAVMFTLTSDANTVMQAASTFPVMLIDSKYSRANETEADRYALEFLQRARISPEYYATILRKLQKAVGPNSVPGFLASHPATAERVKLVESKTGKL
ncbi:MAG: M48 family metallopeptidase [Gammaproteobacteria bacterium]|jgi:predicted Zn-dependent protease